MDSKKSGAYFLLALSTIKFIADVALWAAIGALLVLFGLQFPHAAKIDSLWLIQELRLWGDPGLAKAVSGFGWAWPSAEISPLPIVCGFVFLAGKVGFDAVMSRLQRFLQKRLPLPEKTLALSASVSSQGISVSSTLLALAAVSDKAMARIRRRYARVERELAKAKPRQCAFLSVRVVGAVEMKLEATPEKVSRSFHAYEEMLEEIFRDTGAWKEAWTPEGIMV